MVALRVQRRFEWALVIVCDRGIAVLPDMPVPPHVASANQSAVVVPVRHAQDLLDDGSPAEVVAEVRIDDSPPEQTGFGATLVIRSGALELGDADRASTVTLEPG